MWMDTFESLDFVGDLFDLIGVGRIGSAAIGHSFVLVLDGQVEYWAGADARFSPLVFCNLKSALNQLD